MLRIALIGHDTRNDNLGVGALTVSEIEIIRQVSRRCGTEVEISVLIGSSARQSCISGGDVTERFVRPLRKPWDFLAAVRACDLVIDISGGDSFTDIYGGKRIFQDLLQKYLVHLAGRPLVLAPQTIGPFRSPVWRTLAARAVRRAAIVATRDAKSTAFLHQIGVRAGIVEASDVALRLPYTPPAPRADGPPRVGLNVSALLMHGGYSRANMFGLKANYPALIRQIAEAFLSHADGCELHLVSHVVPLQRGGVEDDYQACLDLAVECPAAIVAPAFATPSEAKSYIAGMDFFMGARMHACIAAFSSGVPVVPMSYSRKFEGLFGSLGYEQTVDCTGNSNDAIFEAVAKAYERRDDLRQSLETAMRSGLAGLDLYAAALEKLLPRKSGAAMRQPE